MIKKIALVTVFLPALSWAEPSKPWTHDFSLGAEIMNYHYKEPDVYQRYDGDKKWMDMKGALFGVHGSYRLTYGDTLFLQPEGRLLIGREAYRAGDNSGIEIKTRRDIPDLIAEPRLLAGGNIALLSSMTLSPYAGIGYRLKIDDSEQAIVRSKSIYFNGHVFGCYRKSNYIYVPLGVEAKYQVSDVWFLSARGEYDYVIKGWQYTRTEKSVISEPTVTDEQKGTHGIKGEVSVGYQFDKVKLSLTPYCYYWHIGNSTWKNGAREPYNRTIETGLRLGVSF
jgi:hypothetical protein